MHYMNVIIFIYNESFLLLIMSI